MNANDPKATDTPKIDMARLTHEVTVDLPRLNDAKNDAQDKADNAFNTYTQEAAKAVSNQSEMTDRHMQEMAAQQAGDEAAVARAHDAYLDADKARAVATALLTDEIEYIGTLVNPASPAKPDPTPEQPASTTSSTSSTSATTPGETHTTTSTTETSTTTTSSTADGTSTTPADHQPPPVMTSSQRTRKS